MKTKTLKPWNVKPGMRMRVGVRPCESDFCEVVEVEKARGKVTGQRLWRITVRVPACYPPFTGGPVAVLKYRDERCEVIART